MLMGLTVALVAVVSDQICKWWILNHFLGEAAYVSFGPWFNIVRAWNTGVSFSMFNNYGNVGAWLLAALALIIVFFLFGWLRKESDRVLQVALGLIMGGAIGNVIDRVRFGAVFDFLDVHIADAHWPAFNLADSFICIGAALIIVQSMFGKIVKEKQK